MIVSTFSRWHFFKESLPELSDPDFHPVFTNQRSWPVELDDPLKP
jgi:hypothetical protein